MEEIKISDNWRYLLAGNTIVPGGSGRENNILGLAQRQKTFSAPCRRAVSAVDREQNASLLDAALVTPGLVLLQTEAGESARQTPGNGIAGGLSELAGDRTGGNHGAGSGKDQRMDSDGPFGRLTSLRGAVRFARIRCATAGGVGENLRDQKEKHGDRRGAEPLLVQGMSSLLNVDSITKNAADDGL